MYLGLKLSKDNLDQDMLLILKHSYAIIFIIVFYVVIII